MNEDIRFNELAKALKSAKVKLIVKAERSGVYENFGEREARNIREEFNVPEGLYVTEDKRLNALIQNFESWAMEYTG